MSSGKFEYDFHVRSREKALARIADEARLSKSSEARQVVKRENGIFSSLKIIRVDMVEGRINLKRAR